MRLLDFGGRKVAVSINDPAMVGLDTFLDQATTEGSTTSAALAMQVTSGSAPRLVLDPARRRVALTVPAERLPSPNDPTVAIAVLQAAARCAGFVHSDDYALLHGGAVVSDAGRGIAVLDGGRGQGKTSLALAVGLHAGRLLADEFLFASVINQVVVTRPAPRLPWHIRKDIAAFLVPRRPRSRLAFTDDLGQVDHSARSVPIETVLLPDVSLAPGVVVQVPRQVASELLRAAVNDHREKLLDPTLDHVSLFSSSDQVVITNGSSAAGHNDRAADVIHSCLSCLPVYLVGIGRPADVLTSAAAVRRVLGEG